MLNTYPKLLNMKLFLAIMIAAVSFSLQAETNIKNVNTKPKAGLVLKTEGLEGTNGCAVAWHPIYEMYYAMTAGNADYPMESFDAKGKIQQTTTPQVDMRGLWYNTDYETLEGNTYEEQDIVSFYTDEEGTLSLEEEPVTELYELAVNEAQSVLCYNSEEALYVSFDQANGVLSTFDMENGDALDDIELKLNIDDEKINYTTVIYTGIKGGEYGLLNHADKLVYLINQDNGKIGTTIKLPKDAITGDAFRFSYANGQIWLYDTDKRQWTGYRIIG